MRQIILIVLISFLALFAPLLGVKSVYAASNNLQDCTLTLDGPVKWADKNSNTFYFDSSLKSGTITFKFTFNDSEWNNNLDNGHYLDQTNPFAFELWRSSASPNKVSDNINVVKDSHYVKSATYTDVASKVIISDRSEAYTVKLWGKNTDELLCEGTYKVLPSFSCDIKVQADRADQTFLSNWTAIVTNINIESAWESSQFLDFQTPNGIIQPKTCDGAGMCDHVKFTQPNGSLSFNLGQFEIGDRSVQAITSPNGFLMCGPFQFHVYPLDDPICQQSPCKISSRAGNKVDYYCTDAVCQSCSYCRLHPTPTPPNPSLCNAEPCTIIHGGGDREHDCSALICQKSCDFCQSPNAPLPPLPDLVPLCEQVGTDFQKKCKDCVIGDGGMWTAIGCLPVTGLEAFLKDYLFTFGIGIAGGIAFLYFLYGTFLFLTSAGNAEKVAQAKEIIVSALSGLLFIIFSIFLLKIVGADILRIP